ncbi:MAG: pitrilysin family protein [Clostridia bacterium]
MVDIRKLSNGIRVIFEHMPTTNIFSAGMFIKAGSNYETESYRGISHFIEHMVFKGTSDKSAKEIAVISDCIGGMLNAYTGKDLTCFFIKTTEDNSKTALDLIADMLTHSLFDKELIENEKKVVIEEISMYEDSPEDYVHDKLEEAMWAGNALSYPILGYRDTVRSFTKDMILQYMSSFYVSENIVISIAGCFDEESIMAMLEEDFLCFENKKCSCQDEEACIDIKNVYVVNRKKIEQTYLSMAFPGVPHDDDERYPFAVLSGALGQSMSSRLFQIIREEKALVYNIGSSNESYQNGGILNIYAGCNPERFDEMMTCIEGIINDLSRNGLDDEEISRSRDQIRCGMLLGMETTDSRMMSNGRNLLLRGRAVTREEAIAKIDAVTKEDIGNIVSKYIDWQKKAVSVLKPEEQVK